MKSAYSRQFILVAGLIVASFLALGTGFVILSFRYTTDRQRNTLQDNASFISEFTASYIEEFTTSRRVQDMNIRSTNFRFNLRSLANMSRAHVLLCELDGTIIYSADGTGQAELDALVGRRVSQSELNTALIEDSYMGNLGGLYEENRYIAGCPIIVHTDQGEQEVGIVVVSTDADDLTELWRGLLGIFALTTVAALALAFVLTLVTTRQQTKPLKKMAQTVQEFGRGHFEARMGETARTDEMGELARAFNSMADSLSQAETRRSEFIANISHELKTPMTTISGFADGILDGTIPPSRQDAALQTISLETKRLSRLVRRMLDVSRLQAGKGVAAREPFDIVELTARTMVSLEGPISGKSLDVVADLPEDPISVWGDPDAITQVCYNLLENAIKFSKLGGHLWVSVTTQAGKALVTIRNEGETIPPQELDRIFDRFHKSDKSRSMDRDGVGLGLYIVRTILHEHKENITVQSEDGLTQFQFTLTLV